MSIFGRVSGHLFKAHQTIADHTPASEEEQMSLLALLLLVRKTSSSADPSP